MANAETTGPGERPSVFEVYKRGQGSRTRVIAALLALFAAFLAAVELDGIIVSAEKTSLDVVLVRAAGMRVRVRHALDAGFFVVLAIVVGWAFNRPRLVDYLVETDQEMNKVTWSPWTDVRTATAVVLILLFFLAASMGLLDTLVAFVSGYLWLGGGGK